MPRTNPKPLRILVIGQELRHSEAIKRFIEKGHDVMGLGGLAATHGDELEMDVDVIIGPRCWRIDSLLKLGDDKTVEESLERQLEMMEKGVRAIKYPKEIKDAK